METLLLYFGKMVLCSVVMWIYYHLFLRDRTFHHYNRFYLLSIIAVSLLLPLLKIEYFTIETDSRLLLLMAKWDKSVSVVEPSHEAFGIGDLIMLMVALVSAFCLSKLAVGLFRIQQLKKSYPREKLNGINFYLTDLNDAPFSFFKNLFWKKTIEIDSQVGRQILKHEMVHIEQKHSWDKMLLALIQSVFWFNPVFYFIKKEINLIHEYLADKKAVKQSDTRAFVQMLLASNFSGNPLPATSPFLSSNLKKRLQMLKTQNPKFSYARRILALPLLFFLAFVYLVNAKNKEIRKNNKELLTAAISTIQKDTLKSYDEKEIDVHKALKDADEKETLFIVEGKEATKKEFQEYIAKNENNKDLTLSYSQSVNDEVADNQAQKFTFFYADQARNSIKNKAALEKILQKYRPNWDKGNPEDTTFDTSENTVELASKEAEKAAKEAEKVAKTVEKMELHFNSKEWKDHMAKVNGGVEKIHKKLNSTEWKNQLKEMEQINVNTPDLEVIKRLNLDAMSDKEKAEKAKKLAEIAQKKAKLEKEKAELYRKQSELMKKELALNMEKISATNDFNFEKISKDNLSVIRTFRNDDTFAEKKSKNDFKIYLNGKLYDQSDFDEINTKDIKSITIFKRGVNGKKENEIHVETKK
ncbi:MAG: M56 family metallopeptidase [Cloacibacterium sp.]|nr:M56 family metallopeptidase [Cloacibacterium sp.]